MRTTTLAFPLLLTVLVACEEEPVEPFASDVFFAEFTEASEPCAGVVVTDTFPDADPPSELISTVGTASIPADYLAVTLGVEGTAFVNFRDDVLLGTVENDGSITAMFTNTESLDETRTSADYTHTRVEQQIVEQMITLTPDGNEENPAFTGSYTRRDYFLLDISENDLWEPDEVGTGATQMPETDDWLEWVISDPPQNTVINQEFREDCPEDVCRLRVEEDCSRRFDVAAVRIEGATFDDFEVLQAFNQPEGAN